MVVLSTQLVCPDGLCLSDLPHIESPFMATSDMRRLSEDAYYRVIRQMPYGFGHLHPSWITVERIRDELAKALEDGKIFLLKPTPFMPAVRRVVTTDPTQNQWEYCGDEYALFFRSAVKRQIYRLSNPWRGGGTPTCAVAAPPFDASLEGPPRTTTYAARRTLEEAQFRRTPDLPIMPPPFVTGLGSEVDAIAAKSPTLQGQLKHLKEQKWGFVYGEAPPSNTNYPQKIIEISPDLQNRPEAVVQQLSHEVGHAMHPTQWNTSSRAAYIDSALDGEGWATLNNVTVEHEIFFASGPDIGIASANPSLLVPQYQAIYQQYVLSGDANTAVNAIGKLYGQHEITGGVPYTDYYGGDYDRRFSH
ncbi:hypothetical protein [Dyella caseinilytica]|uniref:Antirestriction protein ArdC n=1 Tax=Dyella caseinilytica TaxID=1849581 RepID=A0ABX7GPL7_9GAMM|nr:hypothetical protein [Dyella caseinilytica]QRN52360.1 hypothetical protein ISN74_12800 [Dyella caseinilytica]GGA15074.1 hypothetical protein GCM10011408_41340 [Dyella caseinilytica]